MCRNAALALVILNSFAFADPPAPSGKHVATTTLRGPHSAVDVRRFERVTAAADFAKLWREHRPEADNRHADMLDVDWDAQMVVAIFQGKSANSDGVKTEDVIDRGADLLIRYDDYSYQTMSTGKDPNGGAQRVTAFGFIVLPRSEKPIVIEENTQGLIGKPPIWTERVKIPALATGGAPTRTSGSARANESTPAEVPARIQERLLTIAHEYESKYKRADQTAHVAPTDCRIPPSQLRSSNSTDAASHGRKLYYLFARDLPAYEKTGEKPNPVGQVLVKQSWTPRDVNDASEAGEDPIFGGGAKQFTGGVEIDGHRYVAGEPAGLFIMYKTDTDTPNDAGWVYGTIAPDGKSVTAGGKVESCMKCHQSHTQDRLFGPPKDYDRTSNPVR